ncbi:MAG TPA: shikimate kinase [Chloroflexota bacterium]|nr:shikimate kinase [Chloroflexota bacterium]
MSDALVLVGLSGSGKSTVARLAAARLGLAHYDTDRLIEEHAGSPVSGLFASRGEEAFRELEEAAIAEACARSGVVAVGGGAVLRAANRLHMREGNLVVWLDTPPAILAARLAHHTQGEERPLLRGNLDARMLALWYERRASYALTAHLRVPHQQGGSSGSHATAQRIAGIFTAWRDA